MTAFKLRCVIVAQLCLAGCTSQSAQGDSVPALLAELNPQVHAELESVVSAALGDKPVTLGEQVLMRESLLVIERQATHKLQQPRVPGRDMQMPERFQLMTDGEGCWLVQLSSGAIWPLQGASCRPEVEDKPVAENS